MKFGFCLMSDITEIGFFSHVETLGYSSVWVADSQMLFSGLLRGSGAGGAANDRAPDRSGHLRSAARAFHRCRRRRSRRSTPLAPGRVFLGIGTGNTAMRTMGQKPMKIAAYSDYLRVLAALLRGETVDYTFEGVTKPNKKMLHREDRGMRLDPPIPLYVSGFGHPARWLWRASMAMASFSPFHRAACRSRRRCSHARQGAARANRTLDGFRNASLSSVFVLERGEAVDSDRVKAAIGPIVMASVYYFYDTVLEQRHRPAAVPQPHLGALLQTGRSNPARIPALSHARDRITPACIPARRT